MKVKGAIMNQSVPSSSAEQDFEEALARFIVKELTEGLSPAEEAAYQYLLARRARLMRPNSGRRSSLKVNVAA